MDLSQLKWIKNVKHQDDDKSWAYDKLTDMAIPESRIFCLDWLNNNGNVQQPRKGELMALLQNARVTHIVEFLDDEVYKNYPKQWRYRVVKAVWMPPVGLDWKGLPHQEEIFEYSSYIVFDGAAHYLADPGKMPQFQNHWREKGGLPKLQEHLSGILENLR